MKAASILATVLLAAASAWSQEPAPKQLAPRPETNVQAQTAPQTTPSAPGRKLNLAEALSLANRQNLDLAAARLRRAVTQAGIQIAKQIPNPTGTFNASRDAPHEALFFDQPLDISGKRGRRIAVARQEVSLTDIEIATEERNLRREVRTAFYGLMAARAVTAQRADALSLARRLRQIAQDRFDVGDIPQLEVLQADLEVARAEADLTVQQQEEKVALSALNSLLNEPAETLWETLGSLEDLPSAQELANLIGRAAQSNPELLHLAQEIKVEESRRALLRAERIPNLTVEFGSDFNAPGDFRAGPRGGLSMELPIFTRNQGELAQEAATIRQLEAESLATHRAVAGRVQAAYYEWRTKQTQVDLYRTSLLPAARRLESLAVESYRAGKTNILNVLDARRNVQQVEREYLDSLLTLQVAFAGLEEAVGAALD